MSIQSAYSTAVYQIGFTPPVQDLMQLSLTTARLPLGWKRKPHRYQRNEYFSLHRSPQGVWGIKHPRIVDQAVAELFVSRLAVHAGVAVAPTFICGTGTLMPSVMSVVPFGNIVSGASVPYHTMRAYLEHYASSLPFFLWLGDDTDRRGQNRCMNADNHSQFGEFDFDKCDITNVFHASRKLAIELPENLRHVYTMSYNLNVVQKAMSPNLGEGFVDGQPVLRSVFADGLNRLRAIPQGAIHDIYNVIGKTIDLRPSQMQAMDQYLTLRMMRLDSAFRYGKLDRYLVDHLPEKPERPLPVAKLAQHTYSFT